MRRRRLLGLLLPLSTLMFGAEAATLRGTVQTFDRKPILRAGVILFGSLRSFTDDRGSYEIKAIDEGAHDLKIEMAGFRSVEVKGVNIRPDESKTLPPITLDVAAPCEGPYAPQWLKPTDGQASSGELTSKVSDGRGRPLAGIQVTVRAGTLVRSTSTDARGTFLIADLEPGLYSTQLRRRHYWDTEAKDLRVQAGYIAMHGPFTLEKCLLGSCNPALRKRKIIRCE